MTDKKTDSMR